MSQNINIEPAYRTNIILWAAFLMSQFIFLVIIFVTSPRLFNFDLTKPAFGDNAIVVIIFGFLALMNLALSFFMKSQNFQRAVDEQNIAHIQIGLIIAYAFCESISIMGLVLAFAFQYQYFLVWFALGVLGIILHFPRRDTFIAAVYKK